MGLWHRLLLAIRYSLLAIRFLDPLDDPLAEQALRPHQQHDQRQHIAEPVLDAAAHRRAEIGFSELLARTDDQPADGRVGPLARLLVRQPDQERDEPGGEEGRPEVVEMVRAGPPPAQGRET